MVLASKLRERLVVTLREGRKLGELKQIYIAREERRVGALSVRSSLFSGERMIPMTHVDRLGEDVIFIEDDDFTPMAVPKADDNLVSLDELRRPVSTQMGKGLGQLSDLDLDLDSDPDADAEPTHHWRICGVVLDKRTRIAVTAAEVVFGDDVILLPEEAAARRVDVETERKVNIPTSEEAVEATGRIFAEMKDRSEHLVEKLRRWRKGDDKSASEDQEEPQK